MIMKPLMAEPKRVFLFNLLKQEQIGWMRIGGAFKKLLHSRRFVLPTVHRCFRHLFGSGYAGLGQ
jgi:hypothetical protein